MLQSRASPIQHYHSLTHWLTEDVDEYDFDVGVGVEELESFLHLFGRSSSSHI